MSDKQLFPTIEVPQSSMPFVPTERRYRESLSWDLETGDFVRNGANKLEACSGREAYKVWCHKVVQTERYACFSYPDAIGTELKDACRLPNHEAIETSLERVITEALMVNPRTEYVRGFEYQWSRDGLICGFTVKGADWEAFGVKEVIRLDEY